MTFLISLVSTVINAAAALVELLFCIPFVGRLLKWGWCTLLTAISFLFGIFDGILWLLGVRLEKKLRVGVIILRDENGEPLMQPEDVLTGLNQTISTFYAQAKVRVLPVWGQDLSQADEGWVRTNPESSRSNVLNVSCDGPAFIEDLGTAGSEYQFLATSLNFQGNFRRLTGIGSPVMIFVVNSIAGKLGCSLGPWSDYVTIVKNKAICICHELGHACNLPHVKERENLMHHQGCKQDKLVWWQIMLLRASRHVSYV